MFGKIIVIHKSGRVSITKFDDLSALSEARTKYTFIASEWDYSARIGNPINYYFSE